MSDAPISRFSRIMTYPICILPVRRFPRIDVRDAIAKSDLPVAAQQLITDVVRRTRLWAGERGEVALELIAHFHDGLEAGRSAEELMSSFGSIKTAARLIRRGKKRNRPLWWKTFVFSSKSLSAIVVLYLCTVVVLSLGQPTISTDYIAKLNERVVGMPDSQRAYSLYLQVWRDPCFKSKELDKLFFDGKWASFRDLARSEAVRAAQQHPELVAQLRAAAARPDMGFIARPTRDCTPEELDAWDLKWSPSSSDTPSRFAACVIPSARPFRVSAGILFADMDVAACQDDAGRVIADYVSLLGLARHASDMPFTIHQIDGLLILTEADVALSRINANHPNLFAGHRVSLLHQASANAPAFDLNFLWERLAMPDFLQQVYTDDGHGNGRITTSALRVLRLEPVVYGSKAQRSSLALTYDFLAPRNMGWLMLPVASVAMPSRAQLQAQFDMIYGAMEHDSRLPLWQRAAQSQAPNLIRNILQQNTASGKYDLSIAMIPDLSSCHEVTDTARAMHQAFVAALALDVYHEKTGHYPPSLQDLVPQYLLVVPVDYSTGQQLRYKLVDGKPLLYGLGKNGVDDGGVWLDKTAYWPSVPEAGDWVLYPPVEPE